MSQKFTKFTHRGKDRENVQSEALEHLNEFANENYICHFQISEAQVIDGPGMAMPGMQGLAVSPSFELTAYVCYSELPKSEGHPCSCGGEGHCNCENDAITEDDGR